MLIKLLDLVGQGAHERVTLAESLQSSQEGLHNLLSACVDCRRISTSHIKGCPSVSYSVGLLTLSHCFDPRSSAR